MLLKNKVAVITGGGRGIGRSIAMYFAREGADVVLIARTSKQINEVALEIHNLGRRSLAVNADISNEREVSDTFTQIHDRFSGIDILVNNAGVEFKNPFSEMSMDDWDQTMNINARGTVLCTKAVLPGMIKRKEGNIINIASGAGLRGLPGSAAYGASKAAIIALSFALADEIRDQGIRVNVICPGLIKTGMVDSSTILGKGLNVLLPDDVAGTAVFVASELSGKITGQVFSVRNSNRW
ncbi:MAG: SDR family oxidoreductase [Desulfobacula sp.]|jgi:3-oxoacyl-[acyl-carrier protein] reductase